MRYHWLLRDTNNTGCILFMAGWGMDPSPFHDLVVPGHDILMVYDHTDPEPPDLAPLSGYRQRHLLAWSMGVWAASRLLVPPPSFFISSTALAGTLQPVHDRYGIPRTALEASLEQLSRNAADLYRAMFDDPDQQARFFALRPNRSTSSLRAELERLRQGYLDQGPGPDIFDRRIVTTRDRIFPARNQKRAWQGTGFVARKWPHFPFYRHDFWPEILARPC